MDMRTYTNTKVPSLRRLRRRKHLREFIAEQHISANDLCHPIFIRDDIERPMEVENMPGLFYFPTAKAIDEIKAVRDLGVKHFVIRPRPRAAIADDPEKSIAFESEVIEKITKECPDVTKLIDGYFGMARSSGYYAEVNDAGEVDLESSLDELARHAVAQGNAGADLVVSLGRLDGSVATMRNALDEHGLEHVGILAYSINFASTLAHAMLDGTTMAKNAYEQTIASKIGVPNIKDALRQAEQEVMEGADVLGVKPASIFMDAIIQLKHRFDLPIATYIVSKEYCMVKAAAGKGWIDERDTVMEYMLSLKRAGANKIFNYWVKDIMKWIES